MSSLKNVLNRQITADLSTITTSYTIPIIPTKHHVNTQKYQTSHHEPRKDNPDNAATAQNINYHKKIEAPQQSEIKVRPEDFSDIQPEGHTAMAIDVEPIENVTDINFTSYGFDDIFLKISDDITPDLRIELSEDIIKNLDYVIDKHLEKIVEGDITLVVMGINFAVINHLTFIDPKMHHASLLALVDVAVTQIWSAWVAECELRMLRWKDEYEDSEKLETLAWLYELEKDRLLESQREASLTVVGLWDSLVKQVSVDGDDDLFKN